MRLGGMPGACWTSGSGMRMLSPGDVHWIEFPDSAGHEQVGRRPAVILQDDSVCLDLPIVIVVPFTTAQRAVRFEGVVQIDPEIENGLRRKSYALVFQIRA